MLDTAVEAERAYAYNALARWCLFLAAGLFLRMPPMDEFAAPPPNAVKCGPVSRWL
jgi:hypothetical protein